MRINCMRISVFGCAFSALLCSVSAFADSRTLFSLDRVNYRPEKRLRYDLSFDAATCQVNASAPLDVYYIDKATGRRISEFSSLSREYFGPRLNAGDVTPTSVRIRFRAFDEIQNVVGPATLVGRVSQGSDGCEVHTEVSYERKAFILDHIDLKLEKAFGFPVGLEWVLVHGVSGSRPVEDCLIGSCAHP